MPNKVEMVGRIFGRLTVLADAPRVGKYRRVIAKCVCGKEGNFCAHSIRRGNTTSCGCAQRESALTHGQSAHRLYGIWNTMNQRAGRRPGYLHVVVCQEWVNDPAAFISWMLARGWREGLTIDRKDNALGYSPENCRLATPLQQARNRGVVRSFVYKGTMTALSVLADLGHASSDTIRQRIDVLHWDVERAVETPSRGWRKSQQIRWAKRRNAA